MNRAAPTYRFARLAPLLASLVLALSAGPALAAPKLEVTKAVVQVNNAAPPAGDIVSVASGDSIGYSIRVAGNPSFGGTDVTVTDVFNASALTFEAASVGGCVAQAGQVTCTVRLADTGAAELVLTFRVLDVGDCQRLVNEVEVVGEREALGTAAARVEACPAAGGVLSGTPPGNTAIDADPIPASSIWIGLGVLGVAAGAAIVRRRATAAVR